MRIVVVTGLSGSGKSTARSALEDLGFFAIDNLPIMLLDKVIELFGGMQGEVEKLAIVVDARTAQLPTSDATGDLVLFPKALDTTRRAGHDVDLLFLDSENAVLERRFSENRRRHPLSTDGSVRAGIMAERTVLKPLESVATLRIDSSHISVHQLKRQVQECFTPEGLAKKHPLAVTVLSFGFKYGIPTEADLMFDVRFLPNPYFVDGLRGATGEDEAVARFVLEREEATGFLNHTHPLLAFLLPQYELEGKAYLTIAVGCTGGRHRSVAIARTIAEWVEGQGRTVQLRHRDISKLPASLSSPRHP